MIHYHWL